MIILKILAGLIIFLTAGLALFSQFYEIGPAGPHAIIEDPAAAVAPPPVEFARHRGAIACKFDPVTDAPQQFAADYLYGELWRDGNQHVFTARVATPTSGYSATFGQASVVGTQAIVEARLTKSSGATLQMLDTVSMQQAFVFPAQVLTLRVILRRDFAWGPDALICSVVRPADMQAPVVNPPPSTPSATPPATP